MAKSNGLFKEPWLAANLSLLLPGAGQLYARAWIAGGIFFGSCLVLSLTTLILWNSDALPWYVAVPLVLTVAGVWITSIPHAHRKAREQNTPVMEQQRKREKDPFFSAMLGRFIPGAGHMYCGQLGVASALLLGTIGAATLFVMLGWGWVFFAVYPVCAAAICLLSWLAGPEARRTSTAGILILAALTALAGLVVHTAVLLTHRRIRAEQILQERMAVREDGSGSPASIGADPWTDD